MTDDPITTIYNDDGPIDRKRVERIKRLEAEKAALREILLILAEEFPEVRQTLAKVVELGTADYGGL